MNDRRQLTLVGATLLEGVALSAAGLEETSALLGVTVRETHYDMCVEGCSRDMLFRSR